MKVTPGIKDVLWMAGGAAVLLVVMLLVALLRNDESPSEQLASRARRVDLVGRMRLALASASEAEKSALLSATNQDSQTYADQARAAAADAERGRKELAERLEADGTQAEKDLLEQFASAFAELQRIDGELLALAVKNTNIKAYRLAFGPAAEALNETDAALSRLVTKSAVWPENRAVTLLAFGAETGALRIHALLAPHIAEESDEKMGELEAVMTKEDQEVRKDLSGMAAIPALGHDPDLEAAASGYDRFSKLRTEILALSRENTNVRSVAISLNQKRKAMLVCGGALDALQQAILDEPAPSVGYGRFGRPFKLP